MVRLDAGGAGWDGTCSRVEVRLRRWPRGEERGRRRRRRGSQLFRPKGGRGTKRRGGEKKREESPWIDSFGRGVDGDELVDGEDGFADGAGATVRDDEPLYPRADQQPVKEGGRFGARTSCMQGQQYK